MGIKNPWEEIDLKVYEEHMSSAQVGQLQTLNTKNICFQMAKYLLGWTSNNEYIYFKTNL